MKDQLKVLKKFQDKYPTSHVGGSLGLYLRGIDIIRSLRYTDLDIITSKFTENTNSNTQGCSPVEDFDYRYQIDNHVTNEFFKMEIRIDDKQTEFDVINYEGVNYNVSKKEEILKWKQKYAENGSQKHIDDLITIATGVRPKNNSTEYQ